ncbi:DUF6961 family protein [Aurantiacibacter hainanensis]|uniref:DUF6961 family protein n=1 Tax=Aurantiacibacter hainanensis TaxID=3076114 RepID=UPI003EBA0476
MALWVEKRLGEGGHEFIAGRIADLEAHGDDMGVNLWQEVKDRFEKLRAGPISIYGQPETWPH